MTLPRAAPVFKSLTSPTSASPIEDAQKITFILHKILIHGNHVIATNTIQTIFKPYLHHKISLAQLQTLVNEVTSLYQQKGYFLSKALLPPQEINNGIVRITIAEGFISQVIIQGADKTKNQLLQPYANAIKQSHPAQLAHVEKELLLINDLPGIRVQTVLAEDKTTPLGATLTLFVDYHATDGSLTYDNYQTRYLGPYETMLYGQLNSVLFQGGALSGRALSSNRYRSLNYYELRHDIALGHNGLVFSIDGYSTQTNPRFILTPLDIKGTSDDINLSFKYPLIRSRKKSLYLLGQFDYMNSDSHALDSLLFKDFDRDLMLTLQYNDVSFQGETTIMIAADKGFTLLGVDTNPNIARSRLGATPNFFKGNLYISRNQYIGERFSFYGLINGQYANQVLLAAETMTYGGPFLGRGYDMGQFIGDSGLAGKVEARVNTAPNLKFLNQAQYYVFYDVGELWSRIPFVKPYGGASTGLGMRATLTQHINCEGFFGRALTTPNATEVILGNSGKRFLGYFQITAYL